MSATRPPLTPAKVRELLEAGERLRKRYERDAAPMRRLTTDELLERSR